jgi:hypothetical protein
MPEIADRDVDPPPADTAAEERFWRKGAGAVDTGTIPPEPGSTPAELEEAGDVENEPLPEPTEPP